MVIETTVAQIKDWQRAGLGSGGGGIVRFINFGGSHQYLVQDGKIYLPDQPEQQFILIGNRCRFVFVERQPRFGRHSSRYFYGGVTKSDGLFLAQISKTAWSALKKKSPGDREFYLALQPKVLDPLGIGQGFWSIRRRADLFVVPSGNRWHDWDSAKKLCGRFTEIRIARPEQKDGKPIFDSHRYTLFGQFLRLGASREQLALASGEVEVLDNRFLSLGKNPALIARSKNLVWIGNQRHVTV